MPTLSVDESLSANRPVLPPYDLRKSEPPGGPEPALNAFAITLEGRIVPSTIISQQRQLHRR
jgi:hypothetical protein